MTTTTGHYVGIDLHKREVQVAVLDSEGEIVEEVRVRVASTLNL
jgi:predicted NBD/HSP70 family sugar kinase